MQPVVHRLVLHRDMQYDIRTVHPHDMYDTRNQCEILIHLQIRARVSST